MKGEVGRDLQLSCGLLGPAGFGELVLWPGVRRGPGGPASWAAEGIGLGASQHRPDSVP